MLTIDPEFPQVALPAPLPSIQLAKHLVIDFEANLICCNGKKKTLTFRERLLLLLLTKKMLASPEGWLSIDYLVSQLLPELSEEDDRLLKYPDPGHAIENIVTNVRRKLGEKPRQPQFLRNARRMGYQLRAESGYGYVISPLLEQQ